MTNTINSIDLGKITDWSNTKSANITPITIPGADSDSTETVDMLGVIETISISGRLTGTFDELQTLIFNLKALEDGLQSSSYALVSPYVVNNTTKGSFATPATVYVKVNNVRINWVLPGQNFVDYTIQVIIGAA